MPDYPLLGCCGDCSCGSVLVIGNGFQTTALNQFKWPGTYTLDPSDSDCMRAFYDRASIASFGTDANGPFRYLQGELTWTGLDNFSDGSSASISVHQIIRYDRCGKVRYILQDVTDAAHPTGNHYEYSMAADGTITETGTIINLVTGLDIAMGSGVVYDALSNGGTGGMTVAITPDSVTVKANATYPPGFSQLNGALSIVNSYTMPYGNAEIYAEAQALANLIDLTNLDKVYDAATFPDAPAPFKIQLHRIYTIAYNCDTPAGTEESRYPTCTDANVRNPENLTITQPNGNVLEVVCDDLFGDDEPRVPNIVFYGLYSLGWCKALINGEVGDPSGIGMPHTCTWGYAPTFGHPATGGPCDPDDSTGGSLGTTVAACGPLTATCSAIYNTDALDDIEGITYMARRCEVLFDCDHGILLGWLFNDCCDVS